MSSLDAKQTLLVAIYAQYQLEHPNSPNPENLGLIPFMVSGALEKLEHETLVDTGLLNHGWGGVTCVYFPSKEGIAYVESMFHINPYDHGREKLALLIKGLERSQNGCLADFVEKCYEQQVTSE